MALIISSLYCRYDWLVGTEICADLERFVIGGPTITTFFLFFVVLYFLDEGKGDPNTTISRPSSARQRIAI